MFNPKKDPKKELGVQVLMNDFDIEVTRAEVASALKESFEDFDWGEIADIIKYRRRKQ